MPVGAALTADDAFDDLRPTTLHIEDCTPAAVGQALNAGCYVETCSAPIVSDTQEVVHKCFDYLWQCKVRGDEDCTLDISVLEKAIGWDTIAKWKQLRSRWVDCSLSKVLMQYPCQFHVERPTGQGIWSKPMTVSLVPPQKWEWSQGKADDADADP